MTSPYIRLSVVQSNGRLVERIASRKSRRIFNFIQTSKYPHCTFEVSVTYSKQFTNIGSYITKERLIHALKSFLEK